MHQSLNYAEELEIITGTALVIMWRKTDNEVFLVMLSLFCHIGLLHKHIHGDTKAC